MKVEVAVLGFPSLPALWFPWTYSNIEPCSRTGRSLSLICQPTSEDIKQHRKTQLSRAQELYESRSGRPGLPVLNKPTISVNVKQHFNHNCLKVTVGLGMLK